MHQYHGQLQLSATDLSNFLACRHRTALDLMVVAGQRARTVLALDECVLPVQGPPGSGKTHAGAAAICALVAKGKKVGVTGHSHKVILNLLAAVADAAKDHKTAVKLAHRGDEDEGPHATPGIRFVDSNPEARRVLDDGEAHVVGGTAWLWSHADLAGTGN